MNTCKVRRCRPAACSCTPAWRAPADLLQGMVHTKDRMWRRAAVWGAWKATSPVSIAACATMPSALSPPTPGDTQGQGRTLPD